VAGMQFDSAGLSKIASGRDDAALCSGLTSEVTGRELLEEDKRRFVNGGWKNSLLARDLFYVEQ
jgi:hypothetical protein